jgi:poly(3-hydroxybutyrate) depolymerase
MGLVSLAAVLAGCPVTQSQNTPVSAHGLTEPTTGASYQLYVPSYHSKDRYWPLVITLHGTHGYDDARMQIMEWKHLAEQEGFVVVAPELRSVQGILPVEHTLWQRDLQRDEKVVLAVLDEVTKNCRIDPRYVMLTGFSAGGYPMYYLALRHPARFNMVASRACNSSMTIFESIPVTDAARRLPFRIFWGKDDLPPISNQSWEAVRWLSEHGFTDVDHNKAGGGHVRRPDMAYTFWKKTLPQRYLR